MAVVEPARGRPRPIWSAIYGSGDGGGSVSTRTGSNCEDAGNRDDETHIPSTNEDSRNVSRQPITVGLFSN